MTIEGVSKEDKQEEVFPPVEHKFLTWREELDWDNLSLEEKVEILGSEVFGS